MVLLCCSSPSTEVLGETSCHLRSHVPADLQGCGAQGCAQGCRGVCRAHLGNGIVTGAGDTCGTSEVRGRAQGREGWCCLCCAKLREGQGEDWEPQWLCLADPYVAQWPFSSPRPCVSVPILGIPGEIIQAVPQAGDFCLSLFHSLLGVCADFICLRKSLFPHPKPALQLPLVI